MLSLSVSLAANGFSSTRILAATIEPARLRLRQATGFMANLFAVITSKAAD